MALGVTTSLFYIVNMSEVKLSKQAKGLDKAYKKAQGLNQLVDDDNIDNVMR